MSSRDCVALLLGAGVVLAGIMVGNHVRNSRVPLKTQNHSITIPWLPSTVYHWHLLIEEMSNKYSIDPNLIAIIMTMESGGYSKAQSEAGAKGLMQVTDPTAKDIAAKFIKEPRKKYSIMDPRTNIEFGVAYLAYLRDEFGSPKQGPSWDSTVELIAAGYNGGPGAANNLEQGKGLTSAETLVYSRDAFNMWRERNTSKSPTYDRWKERGGSWLIDKAKDEQD